MQKDKDKGKDEWCAENTQEPGEFCSLPLVGQVCAGNGLLSEDNFIRYEVADKKYNRKEYFYLDWLPSCRQPVQKIMRQQ